MNWEATTTIDILREVLSKGILNKRPPSLVSSEVRALSTAPKAQQLLTRRQASTIPIRPPSRRRLTAVVSL